MDKSPNELEENTKKTIISNNNVDNTDYIPQSTVEIDKNSNPLRNSFIRRSSRKV
jgi:hypothetical protein